MNTTDTEAVISVYGLPLTPIWTGQHCAYRVQRPGEPGDGYHLDIALEEKGVLLAETPANRLIATLGPSRYWWYRERSFMTFMAAMNEAMRWNRNWDPDGWLDPGEPGGWTIASDGRRGPTLRDLLRRTA
jgi:hypothetical protein